MMGLEPSTFCMARASDVRARSRPFAQTAWLRGLRPSERTRANRSERRTLPFLPRLARDRDAHVAGSYRGRDLDTFPRPRHVPLYRGSAAGTRVNLWPPAPRRALRAHRGSLRRSVGATAFLGGCRRTAL